MKKNYIFYLFVLLMSISGVNAQLLVTDHEGNEYEYAKLSDNRNWMLESMRATTDLQGNPLQLYWRGADIGGYADQETAGFMVGFAYLREQILGSPGPSAVRTYSARTRGICPEGWYVPEYGGTSNRTCDYNILITTYGGKLGAYVAEANWDAFKAALRLTPDGRSYGKFQYNPENVSEVIRNVGGQLHLITTGHSGRTNPAIMMNVASSALTWGGVEDADGYAGYCRCVENIQSTATFSNFSALGVDIAFSEALRHNYIFDEKVTINEEEISVKDLCPRNFLIKEHGTGTIVEVNNVFKSDDYKNIQIDADFDESKIYELTIVDSKLRESNVPFGGYTFNGGAKMYFPSTPSGVNPIEDLQVKVNVVDDMLVLEQFGTSLNASIFNMSGVKEMSLTNLTGTEYINISNLTKGLYVIQLTDPAEGGSITRKFMVK